MRHPAGSAPADHAEDTQTLDEQLAGLEARIRAATPSVEQQRITDAEHALRSFDAETSSQVLRMRAAGQAAGIDGYLGRRSAQRKPLADALAVAKGESRPQVPEPSRSAAVERNMTPSRSYEFDR